MAFKLREWIRQRKIQYVIKRYRFLEVKNPRVHDKWHMKVVRLSALCTGHF